MLGEIENLNRAKLEFWWSNLRTKLSAASLRLISLRFTKIINHSDSYFGPYSHHHFTVEVKCSEKNSIPIVSLSLSVTLAFACLKYTKKLIFVVYRAYVYAYAC